jgi:PEGA domain
MTTKFLTTAVLSLSLVGFATASQAGQHRGGSSGSGGRAVPRSSAPAVAGPRGVAPRVVGRPGYRPYYYGLRFGGGFYGGYPYGYYPYGYPYGSYAYGYGDGYGYGYGSPYGYVAGGYAGNSYGGVRITDAPQDAAVYADGYYVGVVDDFDGTFQRLSLEAGAHHIEIMKQGEQPIAFDVNVRPGQTITYRAN